MARELTVVKRLVSPILLGLPQYLTALQKIWHRWEIKKSNTVGHTEIYAWGVVHESAGSVKGVVGLAMKL